MLLHIELGPLGFSKICHPLNSPLENIDQIWRCKKVTKRCKSCT